MLHKSLTFRLTLSFSLAGTLVLLSFGTLIWYSVEQHFKEQDQAVLSSKVKLLDQAFMQMSQGFDPTILKHYLSRNISGQAGIVIVLDANQQTLFTNSKDIKIPPSIHGSNIHHLYEWQSPNGTPWRGFSFHPQSLKTHQIILAVNISHHQHFMYQFWQTLALFSLLATATLALLSWLVVNHSLKPLQTIKREAEEITAHCLHTRLNMNNIPDELAELVNTLNTMFARLEESFQRLSDFSSDLAHELRTPVSNLLTQTQVTLSQTRATEEYEEILASNAEELERLSRMVSDMLFLAKAENQQLIPNPTRLILAKEVSDLFEFYEILAEEKSITLSLLGNAIVNGDKLMLRRAISNLLSNALRYTQENGHISVNISHENETTLTVKNTGSYIPKEQLNKLFERFYRTDDARQRTSEGTGLGLAITKSIITTHGGKISASSDQEGTSFIITLPTHT